jgi:hypothetical protein
MKLERAKRHLTDLQNAVRAFFDTKPYKFSGKPNTQTHKTVYTMDSVELIPAEIPLIAGDVIQTLRSALDHVAYQLFRRGPGGKGDSKHIYFPIAENKLKYDKQKGGQTSGMSSQAVAAIDVIQPYGGGNNVLWHLHALNKIDKHRLMLTAGSAVRSVDFGAYITKTAPKESPLSLANLSFFLKPADNDYPLEVGTIVFTDIGLEAIELPIEFEIVLYEKRIVEGKPLLETVHAMIVAVEKVIADLRPFTT